METYKWVDWILQFSTLAVTLFFTAQLVANDNRRRRDAKNETLKRKVKNHLVNAMGTRGLLQGIGKNLVRSYPGKEKLIIEAHDDLYSVYAAEGNIVTPEEFGEMVFDGQVISVRPIRSRWGKFKDYLQGLDDE